MAGDPELGRLKTAWVRGTTDTKLGTAVLTPERLAFWDTKFLNTAGSALQAVLVDRLQKRHEEGGPMFDLPLASITRITRAKKLLNKNRIVLATSDGEYVLNDGWKDFAPLLRDALNTHHSRMIVQESDEDWRIQPA